MENIRLQKYLADCGIASRRSAEELILRGKVKVNGKTVKELGVKVDLKDKVEFNGKIVKPEQKKIYIMLNKPIGYLSTVKKGKEKGKTVLDLVKVKERLFPIGRLDKDSSGLLILTNDGDLALKLTHPRFEKEKEYSVTVDKEITKSFIEQMKKGVKITEGKTLPAKVKQTDSKNFQIVLREGKNRQIRRMCESLGYRVRSLSRIRINKLKLAGLKSGEFRYLNEEEIKNLVL
ncbi:MAG TPA: pseudouridine synthase [Candidatus Bipolaricaulota bacterium]|nr:pseudouridine synthase [Candidatus Bipolaricaulota bacterium]